jgi:2-isopropylmalate synthase
MNTNASFVQIYDTTLRDGTQSEGFNLSASDKIRIAQKLDEFGVAFIEGGWPGSNPKDAEFFERAREIEWKHATIAAFGSTCRVNGNPEDDANLKALLDSGAPVCTIFGKTSTYQVKNIILTTPEENLRIIEESVRFLTGKGRRVIYDAEHFFDGYKLDPEYALQTLFAAKAGGAEILVLCDTNGGTMPWEVESIVEAVLARLDHPIGIHAHNDSECAVINSLVAVRKGAIHVQGTINGYGERCGNANLCSIIPDLELKLGLKALPHGHLSKIYAVSHFVDEIANRQPNDHLPYVGKSAFTHKGGVHVSAIRRDPASYQHVAPETVGNQMRVIVSDLSGRANLLSKAEEHGFDTGTVSVPEVLKQIKELENQGFSFEAAEASVALMFKRTDPGYLPPFELIDFSSTVQHRQGRGIFSEATVKILVDGESIFTAAEGNGPVKALDTALRRALRKKYPHIEQFHLADYKVRILDSASGTGAITRVLIDMQHCSKTWSTVGASSNIIEASWKALADAVEYGLLFEKSEPAPKPTITAASVQQ